jgi:hypothetical protein
MNNPTIKKCLKSYLSGKKYFESDIDKSFDYFKQCIILVNNIKDNNIELDDEINDIINETEIECSKYITTTIEKSLNIPINITNDINLENYNLFKIIETGEINELKKYKYNELKFNLFNEYGLTPLHYAIKYGDTTFLKHAFKLGAKIDQTNLYGHTLLEYSCIENDPNMINFFILYGADPKKHISLRKNIDKNKYHNKSNQIDIILLEILIMNTDVKYINFKYLEWIFNFLSEKDKISIKYKEDDIILYDYILKLDNLINTFNKTSIDNYIMILKEELSYNLYNKLECPLNKIEIILYNLCPFINYEYNLRLDWLINLEIKYLILKILKSNLKINLKFLKNEIMDNLSDTYINTNLLPINMINIFILQWINKIKV